MARLGRAQPFAPKFGKRIVSVGGPTNYPVTLSPATYTFTPSSLSVVTNRKATLSNATYTLTATSLSAVTGRKVTLSNSSYAFSGSSLTTAVVRKVTLSAASYLFSGSDLTVTVVTSTPYSVVLSPATFRYTPQNLVLSGTALDVARSKGGWDPYYYKKRNKRRSKKEDVQDFLGTILGQDIEDAPAPVIDRAEDAKIAATQYLAIADTALVEEKRAALSDALDKINKFYSIVRVEAKRRADEEDEEDLLLLS